MVENIAAIKFSQLDSGDTNITILQGKTLSFSFTWGGATPIDVTGYDARMAIRKTFSTISAEAEFTVANGRVSIGGVNGLIDFSMTAVDCADLTPGRYVYDVEVVDGSGVVHPVIKGFCDIIGEATK